LQQPIRIVRAKVAGDALPCGSPDARTDLLDRHHQRVAEEHGPTDGKAELRSRLRISGDATRIIVGGAGDETWAEDA